MAGVFRYNAAILERFPATHGGVVHASGVANDVVSRDLADEYVRQQRETIDRIGDTPLAELPSIGAWRRVFTAFGVKPTQYRSAAEALLRRLTKQGDVPSINPLVDIGNLISIRYAMPVAVFDQAGISPPTTVAFATGAESFTDLGSSETMHPQPGEVVFVDADGIVSARRWCWRQSAQSATGPETNEAVFVIEGHHPTAAEEIGLALTDLRNLLGRHQPAATLRSGEVSARHPEV